MKTAKTQKLLALLTLLVLTLAFAFMGMQSVGVKADSVSISTSSYFNYSLGDREETEIKYENNNVIIPLSESDKIALVNQQVIGDYEIIVKIPSGVEEFTVYATSQSLDVNGNKTAEGKFIKEIENKLVVKTTGTATLNGGAEATGITATDGKYTINFGLENNFVTATVNGKAVDYNNKGEYKIEVQDKALAKIELSVNLPEGVTEAVNVELISVDQKASDTSEKFKQEFKLNSAKSAFEKRALPAIRLNDGFMKMDGDKIVVLKDVENTLSISQYALISPTKTFKLKAYSEDVWVGTDNTLIIFNKLGDYTFSVVDKADASVVYGDYKVIVKTESEDVITPDAYNVVAEAPKYNLDATAIEAYKNEIKELIVDKYDDNGNPVYIRIGSGQSLKLPSLESMLSDNVSAYDDLTFTLCYKTPSAEQTTSGLSIPLSVAGKYEFYVLVTDEMGNGMTTADFYTTYSDGKTEKNGQYKEYVFSFTILDNAPISVKSAKSQGEGYIGVNYTASAFTIEATSYEAKYTLLYSKDEKAPADKWVEIPKFSDVKDTDYNKDGFTYAQLESIAYDGNLSFKPDRAGYYKIVCTITSTTASRVTQSAETTAISIQSKPKVVVAKENNWALNNVWSIVFLSVGTVCLIAIIVLLFIKPKEVAKQSAPRERTRKRK